MVILLTRTIKGDSPELLYNFYPWAQKPDISKQFLEPNDLLLAQSWDTAGSFPGY